MSRLGGGMEINMKTNILLTAFRGTSAELLIKDIKKFKEAENCSEENNLKYTTNCSEERNFKYTNNYRTLILPNDKIKDSEKLIDVISREGFDYVISFGQRPNIKDKVHIETTAKDDELNINTNFDCDKLKQSFELNGIISKISHNAGTSFCNQLYLNCLKYIFQNNMETKMVFVHVPFKKNITDFDSFRKKLFNVIEDMENY